MEALAPVVHVMLSGVTRCGLGPWNWRKGDPCVSIWSAYDKNLLAVTCPMCLAVVNRELAEG